MTIIELRPAEGGADAAAFAGELADAICAYLRRAGHDHSTATGGARMVIVETSAPAELVRWLGGTHRVQRVPVGASARHTSSVTVAVLDVAEGRAEEPEMGGVMRVDRYRGHGPGGQRKNKVATAIRLVHEPTGITITRETGRSQADNLADAQRELRQRLHDIATAQHQTAVQQQRQPQVASTNTPKTFTHNEQRSEVTDHETGRRWTMKNWARGRLD